MDIINRKVLLIQPNYRSNSDINIWESNPPIGLCYLGATLENNNISVEIIDAHVENYSVLQLAEIIKQKKPLYVGFSIMTPGIDWSLEVVKKIPNNIIKIAGGPHPTALPRDTLKAGFDIIVSGEGEETLLEIVRGDKLKNIKGIYFKTKTKITKTEDRPLLDPNKIPIPARRLLRMGGTNKPYLSAGTRYFPWSPIFTSRGCPYMCYFCNKNIFGYKFRPRTPENVIEEIDHLVRVYKVKEIDIYDDAFNIDIKRAEKILDLIIQRKYKLYLRFSNGIRADRITIRLLKKMKAAGTDYIAYGVESADPNILKFIPKGETISQITRAVKLTHKVGIPVMGFFILGLIGDTQRSMQKTIDYAKKMPFDKAIFNIAAPYPGTRMWDVIKNDGGQIYMTKWSDYYHVSGKMHYFHPNTANSHIVEMMYKKAFREFYFRPGYMMKQLPKLLSPSMIVIVFHGIKRIIYSQIKNK